MTAAWRGGRASGALAVVLCSVLLSWPRVAGAACGDVNGDDIVDVLDIGDVRDALAGAISLAIPGNCNVRGVASAADGDLDGLVDDCDIVDFVVLARSIATLPPPRLEVCLGPAPVNAVNTANQDSAVGINLQRNRFFETALPWTNALKLAESWRESPGGSGCLTSNQTYTGALDGDGYPLELGNRTCIHTRMFGNGYESAGWPLGQWVLRFDGDGAFLTGGAGSGLSVNGQRGTFDVGTTGGSIYLAITDLDPANPPRDLRVYPPGGVCAASDTAPYDLEPWSYCSTARCSGGQCRDAAPCGAERPHCIDLEDASELGGAVFHPLWLSRLQRYRTLRMMDFTHTNHSRVVDFAHWMTEGYFSWGYGVHQPRPSGGNTPGNVPLNVVARLCNTLNAECYVNIPHQATDANVVEMARLFRDQVAPHLPVYMEYSNEVWNGIFDQHHYSYEAAEALPDSEFDGTDCLTSSRVVCSDSFVGKRTFEICELARAAFEETGMGDRLVCVLGRQASDAAKLGRALDCSRWLTSPGGNCHTGSEIDMVAIAPYFGDRDDCTAATSVSELCDLMETDVSLEYTLGSGSRAFIRNQLNALAARGLDWPLITYEGGSHQAEASEPLCQAVAIDPCIRDVYMNALTDWKAHSASDDVRQYIFFNAHTHYPGSLFGARGSWFGPTGDWPKEAGILDWAVAPGNTCWWPGCTLPLPAAPPAP